MTRSGQTRSWSVHAVKLSDTRLLGFVSDVTERVGHQQRLRQEKDRVQLHLDTAAIMLLGLDADGAITLINQRGCEVLGVEGQEQLLGQDWFQFVPREDRDAVRRIHRTNIEGAAAAQQRVEGRIITARGEPRWIVWNNAVVRDQRGDVTGTFSSGEDVTARREMEAQLSQADRLSSLGMLAAGVAHEINNPLSFLLYNLESLTEDLPKLLGAARRLQAMRGDRSVSDPTGPGGGDDAAGGAPQLLAPGMMDEIQAHLDDARLGADRIRDVARSLGAFSRVDEDRLVPVDLPAVIDMAVNMAHNEIKYRARLVRDCGEVPAVLASAGRLSQVFLNLLINAAHAIDEGDREGNEIRLRTWTEGDEVLAEVSDTGSGIAAEDLDRLFDPFFTTKTIGLGTGLGLPISRNIIQGYDGAIDVRSKLGEGTRFTIRLPAMIEAPAPVNPRIEPEETRAHSGRILIVDDEDKIRAAMVQILRGYDTVQAASGAEAMQVISRDPDFDLILCDMMMSNLSGMDLHRWLVQEHPQLAGKVIFITGGAFSPRSREYLNEIDNITIEKPFDIPRFKKIVSDRINQAAGDKK